MFDRLRRRRRMKKYLLNRASEAERIRLEDAWFAEDAVFEELEATDQDLVDAFVLGGLTARERSALEARAKTSPALQDRIAVARRLIDEADWHSSRTLEAVARDVDVASPPSWRRRLALVPAAGLAVLVLAAGIWWLGRAPAEKPASGVPASQPSPRQASQKAGAGSGSAPVREPGEPSSGPASASGRPTADQPVAVTLFPGMPRSVEQGSAISLAATTTRLELSLEYDGEAYETYDAVIRTPEGRTRWERSGVKRTRVDRPGVTLMIDAHVLQAGDYLLTLIGRRPDGARVDIAEYAFRIFRR